MPYLIYWKGDRMVNKASSMLSIANLLIAKNMVDKSLGDESKLPFWIRKECKHRDLSLSEWIKVIP